MDNSFCIAAIEEERWQTLARFGKPEIFNTDSGSQLTSPSFTGALLAAAEVQISMDGRGRWWEKTSSSSGGGAA